MNQFCRAFAPDFHRNLIRHIDCRGAGSPRIGEYVYHQKFCLLCKSDGFGKILVPLARESGDDVGRKLHARNGGSERLHARKCGFRRIFTAHQRQYPRASALHGQVKVRGQGSEWCDFFDKFRFDDGRIQGAEPHATDPRNGINGTEQIRKVAVRKVFAPRAGFNAGQNHLPAAPLYQTFNFPQDFLHRLGADFAPRQGNGAVGAPRLTPVFYFDICPRAVEAGDAHGFKRCIFQVLYTDQCVRIFAPLRNQPAGDVDNIHFAVVSADGIHTGNHGGTFRLILRHTTCDNDVCRRIGCDCAADELAGFAVRLCGYRAGVDDIQIAHLFRRYNPEACLLHGFRDGFRFILIDFASQCHDSDKYFQNVHPLCLFLL